MDNDILQTNEFIAPAGKAVAYVPEDEDIEVVKVPPASSAPQPETVQEQPAVSEEEWEERIRKAREEEAAKVSPVMKDTEMPEPITNETIQEEKKPVVEEPAKQPVPEVPVDGSVDTDDMNDVLAASESEEELDDTLVPETNENLRKDDEVDYPHDDDEDPVIDVPIGNMVDDITKLSAKYNPTGDPRVIGRRVKENPDDFYFKVLQLFTRTGSTLDLIRSSLETEFKRGHVLKNENLPNCEDTVTRSTIKPAANGERVKLSGREAKLAVLARAKGLRKLHLFNSGFWITIRPPRMAELSQWYNEVSMESKDFGRILSGHVYLFSDVLLKQKFMEFLPSIVVDSNLEGWKAPERLSRMISINDYDVLVWGVCSLIYKEAITVNLHCTNDECQYVATNYKVDLTKLRWNNFDIVPQEAVDIISKRLVSSEKVSGDDLRLYHKALAMRRNLVIGDVTYKVSPPSIHKFIQCGSQFIRDIVGAIKGDVTDFDAELDRSVRTNVVLTYLPWVNRIVTPEFETDDQDAIIAQLETDLLTSPELADKMLEFQFGTKITTFCYSLLKCPKCGKTPSDVIKDYYPLDPSSLFFYLYSRQLSQTLD